MSLQSKLDRFYLDMVINELRLANFSCYEHVTYNSLLYLDIIAYKEHCTASYIADALHVAKSAVTLKVKELEKLGLVHKTRSQEDKRVYYLHVNEKLLEDYKAYDRVLHRALGEIETTFLRRKCGHSAACWILSTVILKTRPDRRERRFWPRIRSKYEFT